jgi:hypothetical protein
MVLSLLLLLLIIAIITYQSMQGLFSALLMTILTVCCVGFSFGVYEWVAINWLSKWKPDFAYAIALALCFGVPLIVLRVAFDQLIKRACLLPAAVDRAGGAVCGIFTAMVVAGVAGTAIQMLPFNYGFFGYSRIDLVTQGAAGDKPEVVAVDAEEKELWLRPDRFASGLASLLSDSLFSGKQRFSESYPDFIQAVGWANSTHSEVGRFAPPGSIRIVPVSVPEPTFVYRFSQGSQRAGTTDKYDQIEPKPDHSFRALRVKLGRDAKSKRTSKHLFTLRQFRLVGLAGRARVLKQFHPIAIQAESPEHRSRHIAQKRRSGTFYHIVDDELLPLKNSSDEVEIVFELPKKFKPLFLEYKLGARVAVSFKRTRPASQEETPDTPEPEDEPSTDVTSAPNGAESSEEPAPSTPRGGRARAYGARRGASFFGEDLPITLTDYEQHNNFERRRGAMANGHVVAVLDRQGEGSRQTLSKFRVPRDMRLLHLNVDNLQAGSLLGRIKAKAITTVQNFTVEDADGKRYKIIGKYAKAEIDNGQVILEIEYFPEQAGSMGGLGPFLQIQDRHLEDDYELFFLFLVEPGARILYFSTGGAADRRDDLQADNLEAPQ